MNAAKIRERIEAVRAGAARRSECSEDSRGEGFEAVQAGRLPAGVNAPKIREGRALRRCGRLPAAVSAPKIHEGRALRGCG